MNVKVLKQVQKLIIQHPLKIQFLMKPSKILRIPVESFSKYNVNIITDKKYITDTINCTGSYVMYEDIKDYLADLAPYGYYNAVLVCGAVSEFTLGVTSKGQFNGETGYGYTYVTICTSNDQNNVNKGTNTSYPYLTTTNVAIHDGCTHLNHTGI